MALPQLSAEQRKEALDKAKRARKERAEIRQKIGRSELSIHQIFSMSDDGNEAASKMRVTQLLSSFPKVGRIKAANIMELCGIAPSRRVKGLGARQRRQLIEALG